MRLDMLCMVGSPMKRWPSNIIVLAIPLISLLFLVNGCSPPQNDVTLSSHEQRKVSNVVVDGKSPNDTLGLPEYASVISAGLTGPMFLPIPLGQVEILSKVSEGIERADADAKKYEKQSMDKFRTAEKLGLVTIKEIEQSEIDLAGRGWNRLYTFTATQKGKDLADPKKSDEKFIWISLGSCTVISIVKDEPCKHPSLSSSEDYRLCLGVHKFEPTPYCIQHYEAIGEPDSSKAGEFKFRAIIKFNPFMNSYSYVTSDWGYLDKDGWETQNCQ